MKVLRVDGRIGKYGFRQVSRTGNGRRTKGRCIDCFRMQMHKQCIRRFMAVSL